MRNLISLCIACCFIVPVIADEAVIELAGKDFEGGGKTLYGTTAGGRHDVNYVYAEPNGEHSIMKAAFTLEKIPSTPLILLIEGCDDDFGSHCKIEITLNGTVLFRGPNEFPKTLKDKSFAIPDSTLKTGSNDIAIRNLEPEGTIGMPPWFRVARVAIASEHYRFPKITMPEYVVAIPNDMREFPEPLAVGEKPGFPLRGIKGWMWNRQQYLDEIPVMAQCKMNFLMNCYATLFTPDGTLLGTNEWWKPLRSEMKEDLTEIIRKCREYGITFCFSAHSQLCSPRPLDPNSMKDIDDYWQNIEWAQQQGVKWFSISLDDVTWGDGGPSQGGREHAKLVNIIFERLRNNDPEAQMIFCPVPYWGDGTPPDHREYLEALGKDLHKDAYVFWTGDAVVTGHITTKAAKTYRDIVNHRLFLWDNYPVNDAAPTLHLAAVSVRDPDLGEFVDGYMSNPLHAQSRINRIPMLTCADYAWNPKAYDPQRSIGQAILRLASTKSQRQVLKDLVEVYPGMLFDKTINTGYNPALARFHVELNASPEDGQKFIERMEAIADRLENEFPEQFTAAVKTVRGNIEVMKRSLEQSVPKN